MKKIFFLFGVTLFTLSVLNLYAGDRMILIEAFTSSTCSPCATNNPVLNAFLNSSDPSKITCLAYHMNWPAPGNDPMHWYNVTDNNARRTFYGVNAVPEGRFDGLITLNSPYSQSTFQYYYNQRTAILSPLTIIVSDSTYGDSIYIRALIYCETSMTSHTFDFQMAVKENHIHYAYPPGTNGETDFHHVMRKMLPTASGTRITLAPGQTKILEYRIKRDTIWNAAQVSYVGFAQVVGGNKEIINAGMKTLDFTMLPYPGYRSVPQGQSSDASYRVRIPQIAAGYNSPVTFTAEVEPATTGITVSFPNGNTLSNFSDSMLVQVNSTASVPAGTYKIVVTGTNALSKSHKTVVNYLVGKNYVYIGSNKNDAKFIVNGTQYTSPQIFEWNLGTQQNLQAVSPQLFGTYRFVFQNWSNGGDTNQTITVSSDTGSYIVNYKMQYKLQTSVVPSGIASLITISGGNLFYDSSSVANISISPTQVQYNNKTYYFQNWTGTGNGSYTGTNPSFSVTMNNFIYEIAYWDTINVGINKLGTEIPLRYELNQNYPNPFNPVTNIKFAISKAGLTRIIVYDLLGKEIETLCNSYLNEGYYQINFNAAGYSSGIYFYRIESGDFKDAKRMVLIK